MNGWMGKIIKINISTGKQETIKINDDLRRKYIGGRGLGVRLYTELCSPEIDPFSSENALIFLTGPLTGVMPTSGRYQVISRSPLTGTICDSSSGGIFGVELKKTGIDGIIILGKAEKPVYLSLTDDGIKVKDAVHLWGLNTQETRKVLIKETTVGASIASIGPAGENQILYASIMNDRDRTAGRGGLGAVMGSKNLKAIVTRGTKKIPVHDPDALKEFLPRLDRLIDKNPITGKSLQLLGTSVLVNVMNAHGIYPTRNFQQGVFNDAEGVSGEKLSEILVQKKSACFKCPIACGRTTRTSKKDGEGPEYETLWAFGAQLGINDLNTIAEANYVCNELGIDTISCGSTIGCAMELSEVGAFPHNIKWGDTKILVKLVEDIAYKRGIGAELALGSKRLAEKYGRPELAMQVKGMEIPAYDPRGVQGQALSYATNNRGGCHIKAYMIGPEILGLPVFLDRFVTKGKAEIVALLQDISSMVDSIILCRFLQFALSPSTFAEMLNIVTGLDFTDDELMKIGKRIYTLERKFNTEAGFTKKDDTLPPRFFNEVLPEGASRNRIVKLDEMLDKYYEIRGWNKNGVPTAETLKSLGI
jgi:aldehyde:ferredoxin oxidoreductase